MSNHLKKIAFVNVTATATIMDKITWDSHAKLIIIIDDLTNTPKSSAIFLKCAACAPSPTPMQC